MGRLQWPHAAIAATLSAVSSGAGPLTRFMTQQDTMAKPNYAFEKRQRELAKKKKKEDKQKQKAGPGEDDVPATDEATNTDVPGIDTPDADAADSTP